MYLDQISFLMSSGGLVLISAILLWEACGGVGDDAYGLNDVRF
jgi:hypothetical protein